jgi:Family of unknown function (DUF6011)
MKTIERNYTKNPHTARFLQTFHSGIGSNGHNYRDDVAALAAEASQDADLLDMVEEKDAVDLRSPRQAELMDSLHTQLADLDVETARKAVEYTTRMTVAGKWTPGRDGNASAWITRMIAKVKELKAAAMVAPKTAGPVAEVPDGRYAVEHEGTLKFFRVKNGNRPGFVFLDVQASDDWHAIRNVTRIREIVALIAVDAQAAMIRYGHELGECGRCGRTLTDEASRAAGIGPICASK